MCRFGCSVPKDEAIALLRKAKRFMSERLSMPDEVTEFSPGAWGALVDYVTVYSEKDVRFTFRNGLEIKV